MLKRTRHPPPGGLYLARRQASSASVIIPPMVRGLADLRCAPRIDARERSTNSVLRSVTVARTWASARLPGDLFSAIRRRDVLRALALHIFQLIGGDTWASAEMSVSNGPDGLVGLKRAISRRREEAGIGAALAIDCAALSAATCEERVQRIASLATSFHVLTPALRPHISSGGGVIRRRRSGEDEATWLSELALRLASDPGAVEEWAGEDLRAGTMRLLEAPTLARAARFLVIATDRQLQSRAAASELYASWGWA